MPPSPKCTHDPSGDMATVFEHAAGKRVWCAHRMPLRPVGQRERPDHDASLSAWLVCCPGAHAFWEWWTCGVYHLRPIEGQSKPATLNFPGASHEFMFAAIDPTGGPPPLTGGRFSLLMPLDLVHQVTGIDDKTAGHILDLSIAAIMQGTMSPDSDYAERWAKLLDGTVSHFKSGKHALH